MRCIYCGEYFYKANIMEGRISDDSVTRIFVGKSVCGDCRERILDSPGIKNEIGGIMGDEKHLSEFRIGYDFELQSYKYSFIMYDTPEEALGAMKESVEYFMVSRDSDIKKIRSWIDENDFMLIVKGVEVESATKILETKPTYKNIGVALQVYPQKAKEAMMFSNVSKEDVARDVLGSLRKIRKGILELEKRKYWYEPKAN